MAQQLPPGFVLDNAPQPVPIAQIRPIISAPRPPNEAAQEARSQAAEARAAASAAREQARFEKEMTTPPKAKEPKVLREGDAQKLTNDVSSVEAIERALNSFQDDFVGLTADVENMAQGVAGVGTPGQRDWWADFRATDNQIRNELFGASLTAGEKSAYSSTTITPRMAPEEVRRNLERRLEIARKAASRRFDRLNAAGYNPDEVLAIVGEVDIKTPIEQRAAPQEPKQLELTAGENFSTEEDKAHADALTQAVRNGASLEELVAISQGFGATLSPDDIASFNQAINVRSQGGPVTFTPRKSGTRSPIAQAAGEALMTPAGTALTGAVNAAGVGLLSQVAGDQVQGLEALNPIAGTIGELGGSMLGTAGLAKGAGAALSMAAPGLAGRLAGGGLAGAVGREALTEGTYGGLYAANTGEDIGTGLALGAAGSLGGRAIGAGVSRAAPVVSGLFRRGGDVPPDGGVPPMGGTPAGGMPPMGGTPAGSAFAAGEAAMQAADEPFAPITFRSRDAGSAGTSDEALRYTKAEGLSVPIELTRGAATRDPEQLAFEKEQIFGALGGPLRSRAEENNLQALGNFERMVDLTGAQETTIATSGSPVIKALGEGYKNMKNKVRVAYTRAGNAPEAQELVPYADLDDFINNQTAAARTKLAPVLQSVQQSLAKEDPNKTGQITVKALEDIRQQINQEAQPGTPSEVYGRDMKGLIDTLAEGKGGELYEKARTLRKEQSRKFEKREIVSRLVSNIKSLDDPKVAANEVFTRSILNENPADIKFLRQTLRTLGPDGRQAWKELEGATIRHLEEKATQGARMGADDNPVVAAGQFKKAVDTFDKDGRLDVIFNPKMAQQIRDLRDVIMYVNTVPPGTSINSSGTGRTLTALLGEMTVSGGMTAWLTGTPLPVPIVSGLRFAMKTKANNEIKKKIARSLLPRDAQ